MGPFIYKNNNSRSIVKDANQKVEVKLTKTSIQNETKALCWKY